MQKAEQLLLAIQNVAKKLREFKIKEIENSGYMDFSISNFRYIEEIHNMGNPTFVELTNRMGLSKPTVTLMVAKLIEKEYVTKTKSEQDGRIYYLSLTPKGEKLINDYNKVYKNFIDQVASRFDEQEIETLVSLLRRM